MCEKLSSDSGACSCPTSHSKPRRVDIVCRLHEREKQFTGVLVSCRALLDASSGYVAIAARAADERYAFLHLDAVQARAVAWRLRNSLSDADRHNDWRDEEPTQGEFFASQWVAVHYRPQCVAVRFLNPNHVQIYSSGGGSGNLCTMLRLRLTRLETSALLHDLDRALTDLDATPHDEFRV